MNHTITEKRLELITQAPHDVANAMKLCPHDQERVYRVKWIASPSNGAKALEFTEVETTTCAAAGDAPALAIDADRTRLAAMNDADLQVEAAKRNVKWDKKASRETMLDRIVEAANKQAA